MNHVMKIASIVNKFLFRPSTLMYTKVRGEGPTAEILSHRWVNERVIPPKHSWLLSVIETQNDIYIILNMDTWSWKSIWILDSLYSTDRRRILANMDNYVILCIFYIFFRQTDPVTAHQASSRKNWVGMTWILFCAKLHPFMPGQ